MYFIYVTVCVCVWVGGGLSSSGTFVLVELLSIDLCAESTSSLGLSFTNHIHRLAPLESSSRASKQQRGGEVDAAASLFSGLSSICSERNRLRSFESVCLERGFESDVINDGTSSPRWASSCNLCWPRSCTRCERAGDYANRL